MAEQQSHRLLVPGALGLVQLGEQPVNPLNVAAGVCHSWAQPWGGCGFGPRRPQTSLRLQIRAGPAACSRECARSGSGGVGRGPRAEGTGSQRWGGDGRHALPLPLPGLPGLPGLSGLKGCGFVFPGEPG